MVASEHLHPRFAGVAAANAAAAVLNPRYLRKSLLGAVACRKDFPSSASNGSSSLNSSLAAFWYASELFNSPKLCQYLLLLICPKSPEGLFKIE